MTTKADFTDEEWTRLERSPLVAGMAISLADPGGPIELAKESMAAVKTILGTAEAGGNGELVDAVSKDVAAKAQKHENPMKDFKPRGALAGEEILEELRAVNGIVTEKATPEEAEAFRRWLLERRPALGGRRQGGRLPRLQRAARERGRAEDARQARRGAVGVKPA